MKQISRARTYAHACVIIFCAMSAAFCGKQNEIHANHNLPVGKLPPTLSKPSAACLTGAAQVGQILQSESTGSHVTSIGTLVLNDGSCAVTVKASGNDQLFTILSEIKKQTGFYTHIGINKALYKIWIDEPNHIYPPLAHGTVADNLPTAHECVAAAQMVNQTGFTAGALATTIVPKNNFLDSCFVQVVFKDVAKFQAFMTQPTSPYSLTGEILHVNLTRPDGVVVTVWIQALMDPGI